jgi:jumonji domain-containing protein 7
MSRSLDNAITELIESYQQLNPSTVDELYDEPTALEFMRYVARNQPFVIRKGAAKWEACLKWSAQYLLGVMGNQRVNVAMTPFGNADSPLETEEHGLIFVKPYEREMPFDWVLKEVHTQEADHHRPSVVCYAQTQNDNLRNEYETLFNDVPSSIDFARVALQQDPEAINFWLGNSLSTTALHRDPYENIYVQVLGQKHFVLLPPVEVSCVNEQVLPAATYIQEQQDRFVDMFRPQVDQPPVSVPFATWDPDTPDRRPTIFSHLSRPYRVTLESGDMLYLPALWYHKVKQSCDEDGICVAVNYWYDMEFTGPFQPMTSFVRIVGMMSCAKG